MRLSRRMIQKLTRARGIMINRKPAFLARKVRLGDRLAARIGAPHENGVLAPKSMDLSIAYEDDDVIVIDKPAGILVHPTGSTSRPTLSHGVAHHFALQGLSAPVRPVHRLDRDTTGLVIFARSAFAHQQLDLQLRHRDLVREYLAVVTGIMDENEGVVDAPIGRVHGDPRRRTVRPDGDPARTHFEVVRRMDSATLVKVRLETGRTHQIRVHMRYIGHAVLGDRMYGGEGRSGLARQALHAESVTFRQPRSGEVINRTAPLPADLVRLLEEA